MSFYSWLQNRSALAPNRAQRRRRDSTRAVTRRPSLEVLEDRVTPSLVFFSVAADEPPGVAWSPYTPLYRDFTSDGIVDELSTISQTEVAVRPGRVDGTFGDPIRSYAPHAGYLAVADFDGDGRLDVATATQEWGTPNFVGGSVLLGEGDGTFLWWDSYLLESMAFPDKIGTVDFSGDGLPDVVVGGWDDFYASNYFFTMLINDGLWRNPQLRIGDLSVNEGNTGVVEAAFTVNLEYGPDQPVTVQYATGSGTATAGADFQAASGTLTFAPGETSKTITVQVIGDRLPEPNETFFAYLGNPTNAVIAAGQGVGYIIDDEPRLSIAPVVSRSEGNIGQTPFAFSVTLSPACDAAVTVDWATANGSATSGSDYHAASSTLTFAPGETSKTITVQVIGDRLPEPEETFYVWLSNPTNATVAGSQSTGTILDDEPRISISDVSRWEGRRRKTTLYTFTVTLSAAYDQAVTMSFRTVDGTATTSDNDYLAKSGTLTFAPGETTKTITIEVKGDNKSEANETFYLDLFGNSGNSLFSKNRGLGTILNDD